MKPISFMPLSYFKLQGGSTIIMHISFSSLAPRYTGTSGDRGHTRSLEADKSPANIHRLPRRVGQGRTCQITAHLRSRPKWSPSSHGRNPCTCYPQIPYTIMTNAPLLPGLLGAGDTNDRCISINQNLIWCYTCIVLWSTQRLSSFMSTQRISQHVDIIFNISTKEQWKNKMSIITWEAEMSYATTFN